MIRTKKKNTNSNYPHPFTRKHPRRKYNTHYKNNKKTKSVWDTIEKKEANTIYIYFIHVPKTAGSAIKQTLAHNDTQDKSIKSEGWTLYTRSGVKVRIIANGHSVSSSFNHRGPNVFKIATIREPIQRFISAYNFVREGGKNHPNQGAVQQARNWAPYLQKYKTIDEFLSDEDAVRYIMDAKTGHTHFDHLMRWIRASNGKPDIGIYIRQTHVNEDFKTMCDIFDLDIKEGSVKPFNVTLGKSKITKTTDKKLVKLLHEDIILYNQCLQDIPSLIEKTQQRVKTFLHQRAERMNTTSPHRVSAKTTAPSTAKNTEKVIYIKAHEGVSNHFWHFMMGEFLPIMYVILKGKYKTVYLKKSKSDIDFPLNAFYHEVCEDMNITLHITNEEYPGKQYITPLNWDWKNRKEEYKLLWITRYLKHWAQKDCRSKQICVVQDRSNSTSLDTFYLNYKNSPVKRKIYGAKRRHITNLKEVVEHIRNDETLHLQVKYNDTDSNTLKEQIQQYVCAKTLILGHGAGMVHMLWMQPRSRVIEIIPQSKFDVHDGAVQGAKRLCKLLKFKLERIVVDKEHIDVNVDDVIKLVKTC